MKKTSTIPSALRGTGAKVANAEPIAELFPETLPKPAPSPAERRPQPSRIGTKPITVHLNEESRRQLKALAGEEGRTVESMVAEALNLLFARYRKPEVAVSKGRSVD
jgi:hypothetical protein